MAMPEAFENPDPAVLTTPVGEIRNAVVFPAEVKNVDPPASVATALTAPRFEPRIVMAPNGA